MAVVGPTRELSLQHRQTKPVLKRAQIPLHHCTERHTTTSQGLNSAKSEHAGPTLNPSRIASIVAVIRTARSSPPTKIVHVLVRLNVLFLSRQTANLSSSAPESRRIQAQKRSSPNQPPKSLKIQPQIPQEDVLNSLKPTALRPLTPFSGRAPTTAMNTF